MYHRKVFQNFNLSGKNEAGQIGVIIQEYVDSIRQNTGHGYSQRRPCTLFPNIDLDQLNEVIVEELSRKMLFLTKKGSYRTRWFRNSPSLAQYLYIYISEQQLHYRYGWLCTLYNTERESRRQRKWKKEKRIRANLIRCVVRVHVVYTFVRVCVYLSKGITHMQQQQNKKRSSSSSSREGDALCSRGTTEPSPYEV
ncbi:unnamed protein product [Trichogramma brassicae]|uniref:Uncharacterized protein n=1 Tax=Trichogramma brassicae TaxID=86971 RepID=A0A6H5I6L2_9HYME|nr:unnamed protein product [Trichogramma brassicae]